MLISHLSNEDTLHTSVTLHISPSFSLIDRQPLFESCSSQIKRMLENSHFKKLHVQVAAAANNFVKTEPTCCAVLYEMWVRHGLSLCLPHLQRFTEYSDKRPKWNRLPSGMKVESNLLTGSSVPWHRSCPMRIRLRVEPITF